MNARQLAYDCLLKIEQENSYSNLSIAGVLETSSLEGADKAFFTALVYGVIERKLTLDYNIDTYLKNPKIKPQVRTILRLGAYQILFMDKIPDHAAINESVNLAKKHANYASGLTNAVLRKIASEGLKLPKKDADNYLEIKYSCPNWLINMWNDAYGYENTIGILESSLGGKPVYKRVCPWDDSLFHVQDLSSQKCCEALGALPGETIYDMCAAPGGKSFTIAEIMNNEGKIQSFDIHPHRVKLIEDGAKRLGIEIISASVGDAEQFNPDLPLADRVLCDVPCAGLGVIGRKPEIRYKSVTNIEKLPNLQYNILINSARYIKIGGTLLYSTCSLNPMENENVVNRFINDNKGFELKEMRTIFPQEFDCDGFFYAVIGRVE